jgi:hypothetical protein
MSLGGRKDEPPAGRPANVSIFERLRADFGIGLVVNVAGANRTAGTSGARIGPGTGTNRTLERCG